MAVVAAATLTAAVGGQSPAARNRLCQARLWDGKTPDFRGIWQVRDTAYVNIEGHAAEKRHRRLEEHQLSMHNKVVVLDSAAAAATG